jgi:transcriptional regulator with PAS, ATPase and Fis domain
VHAIRSILWIGAADRFAADVVSEAPSLDVVWERNVGGALALPLGTFDALVLDAAATEEALSQLAPLRRSARRVPILVRIDASEVRRMPELIGAGAGDVMLRGIAGDVEDARGDLLERLERLATRRTARGAGRASPSPDIIGDSPPMREVFELIACASRTRATVLVTGETGTGKELVARAIHRESPRRRRAFVAINCAAFPDTLLESELFGHTRGAFTGADRDRKGLLEEADGGTLFLDEVSETSGPFQAKLLRALQEREVRPLGSARSRSVDVRVVAATNRDLWSDAQSGYFRQDLYYRLAVFPVHMPPLRDRPGDLLALARHFLATHARSEDRPESRLSRDAEPLLQAYSWPGNVRELDNEIQRALALAESGEALAPQHFSRRLFGPIDPEHTEMRPGETLRESMARVEAWLIRRALADHDGRRAETARRLSITREGLYKKMKRFGIE